MTDTRSAPSYYESGIPVVYRAVCLIDGRDYIGATMRSMSHRAAEHASAARTGKSKSAFARALVEHGPEMFRYSILVRCETLDQAREHEARLITLMKPAYNRNRGGSGARPEYFTAESRALIGAASLGRIAPAGRPRSDRTRQRLREVALTQKDVWAKKALLGSAAMSRRVACLDDGLTFDSASAAARYYGAAKSAIIELCLGQRYRKTVNGRRFAYINGDA